MTQSEIEELADLLEPIVTRGRYHIVQRKAGRFYATDGVRAIQVTMEADVEDGFYSWRHLRDGPLMPLVDETKFPQVPELFRLLKRHPYGYVVDAAHLHPMLSWGRVVIRDDGGALACTWEVFDARCGRSLAEQLPREVHLDGHRLDFLPRDGTVDVWFGKDRTQPMIFAWGGPADHVRVLLMELNQPGEKAIETFASALDVYPQARNAHIPMTLRSGR